MREWVEGSSCGAALLVESTEDGCGLLLSYREVNSNPGGVLHGRRAASLAT
ncbi:MAG: hypothetical protein WB565_10460 [Acidimicrobiales bacterium]